MAEINLEPVDTGLKQNQPLRANYNANKRDGKPILNIKHDHVKKLLRVSAWVKTHGCVGL
jgi:hypothetical protein